jgi:AcrR family transcriptional regulator
MSTAPVVMDGRIARGVRTRESVVNAFESLIEEGGSPTGAELASRAGVSCRSIFTHFGDMKGVTTAATRRVLSRLREPQEPVSSSIELPERIDIFSRQRAQTLEQITPIYRTILSQRVTSKEIRSLLTRAHMLRGAYTRRVFEPELLTCSADDHPLLRDALVAISSWPHWRSLRDGQGLDASDARMVMAYGLRGLVVAGSLPFRS